MGDSKAEDVRRLHLAGLSVREIAQALNISTQGVYWHLHRMSDLPKREEVAANTTQPRRAS